MKTHTDRQYEAELNRLRELLVAMGGKVEHMIADAVRALENHDAQLAQEVIDRDRDVDRFEIEIDELCLQILALRQPTASDLRFIAASMKLVVDIERIGDIAVNLAERAIELSGRPPLKPYIDLPRMGTIAREMVSVALDAFVRRDTDSARSVFARDNVVDALYVQILRELVTYMMEDSTNIYRATRLLSAAKLLERIGDHATNIAEQVIFMIEGRDIRHSYSNDDLEQKHFSPSSVLFVSTKKPAYCQIAEGWARRLAPNNTVLAAASITSEKPHPEAVDVMKEIGVELSETKALSEINISLFEMVITICDDDLELPGNIKRLKWSVTPVVESLEGYRRLRDELVKLVERLFR